MLRLFLRLYLILALVLALFFVAAALLPNNLLKDSLAEHIQHLAQGTRALLLQRLASHPRSEWPERIEQIAEDFGYPVDTQHRDQLDLAAGDIARLRQGRATYRERDGAQIWYLPLPDSPWVLAVQMGQTDSEHGRRMTIGSFRLIEQELLSVSPPRRAERLAEIAELFWFPLSLLPLDAAELTERLDREQLRRLAEGEVLSFGPDSNTEWFLRRLDGTGQVLKLGPMHDPLVFRSLAYIIYGCLALLVALVVWLWVRPLWRSVMELRRVTAAFGRGELQTRASMHRRAPLGLLGDTFNRMADRIQGLVESHRGLTNAVSHELRTPIARLRFSLEMLEQSSLPAAHRQRHLAGMGQDLGELESLVDELLAFARFEREGCETEALADLTDWLRGVCAAERLRDGLLLDCRGAPALDCRLDPRLMTRAVSNLLRNANKYAAERIRLETGKTPDECWIEVHDDGPGIPAAERERILEPFARLDRSRDRETGGHGLGLAIVQRIMQLHGGGVSVRDSADLGGACLRLQWPNG